MHGYECKATLTVQASDQISAFLGLKGPELEKELRLRYFDVNVVADGEDMLLERNPLGEDGVPTGHRAFYVESNQVILKEAYRENSAQIIPTTSNSKYAPKYWDPIFMVYSFLNVTKSAEDGGFIAIPPNLLASSQNWKSVYTAIKDAKINSDGKLTAVFEKDGHKMVVTFSKDAESNQYLPVIIEDYAGKDVLRARAEISEFVKNSGFVPTPKILKLWTYFTLPSGEHQLLATWEFAIKEFTMNPTIDENILRFDPASVDSIWDAENQTTIMVPR